MSIRTVSIKVDGDDVLFVEASAVTAYVAAWAAYYAGVWDYQDGELHANHYDTLKACGARMDEFTRVERT